MDFCGRGNQVPERPYGPEKTVPPPRGDRGTSHFRGRIGFSTLQQLDTCSRPTGCRVALSRCCTAQFGNSRPVQDLEEVFTRMASPEGRRLALAEIVRAGQGGPFTVRIQAGPASLSNSPKTVRSAGVGSSAESSSQRRSDGAGSRESKDFPLVDIGASA